MKGKTKEHHKAHHEMKRKAGGKAEGPESPEEEGKDDEEEDLDDKPEARTNAKKIDDEAEERNKGGRAKRKRGGKAHEEHKVEGEHAKHHAGRMPRKSGGSCESHVFSAAHRGTPATGRKHEEMDSD